jgi:trk system potassium uptake protein TrkA
VYIVVIGGGRIGYYLSKALLAEGHEVLIVEQNNTLCKTINDELGSVCFYGDGCEASILEEIGTGRADMLIAVTGDDEDNMVACQVAKHRFNVPRTIARIRNPKNEILFKKLGIDVTVSSTDIILESIEKEVPTHPLTHLMEIADKKLELVEIKIPPESKIIGKAMKDVKLPSESVLALIIRKSQKPIMPTDGTIFEADDQIIAVTPPESEVALRTALIGV